MRALLPYVRELERQIRTQELPATQWQSWCDCWLDGAPSRTLRGAVPVADLKARGVFFTSARLAQRAARGFGVPADDAVYLDPACGVGDLLLAVARGLPVARTAAGTLALWGRHLIGRDAFPVFVRAARARLALLAMRRCRSRERLTPAVLRALLPSLRSGDAFGCPELYAAADRIIMNPPFCADTAPDGCAWSTGRTNSAARFAEAALLNARNGARIVAILPDVLRSGSRYQRWRRMVGGNAVTEEISPYGPFDQHADVDVFLLRVRVGKSSAGPAAADWASIDHGPGATVADHFRVHVGAVVPHRHAERGTEYPYLHVRSLPPWQTGARIPETRRFPGTVFRPPFVAVRRTSGPRDRKRAVATIVLGEREVAVENHVLVCLPRDDSIECCQALLERLQSRKTDEWLNRRIRCRHLTVSALAGLPWWDHS